MPKITGWILFAATLLAIATVHLGSRAEITHTLGLEPDRPSTRELDKPLLPPQLSERSPTPLSPEVFCNRLVCPSSPVVLAKVEPDRDFQRLMQWAMQQNLAQRSLPEILQAVAGKFVGTAYTENLLDRTGQETLVVSLKEFDCVLFVETVLAMARGIANQTYDYATFTQHLEDQRYWHGKLEGYCSRLHYFSLWIQDNQTRNTVTDISATLGGIPWNQPLNFMSRHWQKYPKLQNSSANRQCIREMEATIDPTTIHYIPRRQIASLYAKLQPGDIVAIATDIPGLDATHTGLVYRMANGNVGLIHAAPRVGVKISPDLQTYVDRLGAIGIMVARPIDPRRRSIRTVN
jgi:Protein of unknown function (DUF1460)